MSQNCKIRLSGLLLEHTWCKLLLKLSHQTGTTNYYVFIAFIMITQSFILKQSTDNKDILKTS